MKVIRENCAQKFLDVNEEDLLKNESEYNLLLGLAGDLAKSPKTNPDELFLTISDGSEIYGQALGTSVQTPLVLSHMQERAIEILVEFLQSNGIKPTSVVGPKDVASKFVTLYGEDYKLDMHQGVYELTEVIHPDYGQGKLITADNSHLDLATQYCKAFMRDCFSNDHNEELAAKSAQNHIQNARLYFWSDEGGNLVSMAAKNRESRNGATLSWVNTPPEYRNFGYGSKVVASLSQLMLDNGKKICNLYTDMLNPTSNSIYKKVGYQMIGESIHYKIEK